MWIVFAYDEEARQYVAGQGRTSADAWNSARQKHASLLAPFVRFCKVLK